MAERLPYVQQNRTVAGNQGHGAQEWRWMHAGVAPLGVCGAGDLKVTAATGLQVTVAAGGAFVTDGATPIAGAYHVFNDGPATLTLDASHLTLPRIDLVIAEVTDTAAGGAADAFRIRKVTGTAAGSPVAPAVPARSLALAQVSVPATASSVVAGNITDRRVAGGAWAAPRGTVFSVNCGPGWSSSGAEVIAAPTNVTIPTVPGRQYVLALQGIAFGSIANTVMQIRGYWGGSLLTNFVFTSAPIAAWYHGFASVGKTVTATATSTAVKATIAGGPSGYAACDYANAAQFEVRDIGGGVL